ncbi:50S ribosomal protein L25/general stress protein Ctc [Nocardioides marmorisolisilvae]|uniref:Large ribosomal subunit protein bL25 n=1 Tax=Nocardioides marmorisolisilvae TaxID=1542737 RepID=A0A3N0DRS6_9ACTN|nr:50S ribosomal protein L25/general stress protein Ctc [Nocardioides marmorisolisilvae]RNL78338.1 50S ribosomal protein L25/general stress protein Ctc [Nocardioides marmorisolisilvae]
MSEDLIIAETRSEFGKGAARRIRRANKVPAVIYGHGNDPIHVTLPGHDTLMAIKHGGANAVLNIEIDGKVQLALTKQVQADPIKGFLEHVDFVAVKKGEKVTVEVPVHTTGEAAKETFVQIENNVVTLEAEATHIPEAIEVDIEGAEVGTQILAGQLTLPKGSVLVSDSEQLIVNITQAVSAAEVEAELAEAEAEAGIEHDAPADEAAGDEAPAEGDAPAEGSADSE